MKKAFLLLCTLLLVLGSLLPLAGYRLAKAVLGEAAASSEVPASSALPAPGGSLPGTDTGSPETAAFTGDAEVFLIEDQSTGEVQQVPRRDYLIGAVAAEMPLSWPDEALKTQAVAAHSYVLYCRDHATAANGAWLSADPARRQGYLTDAVLHSYWGTRYDANYVRLSALVDSVLTQVLCYEGAPAGTSYFAISNGRTEASENVWGTSLPYLVAVDSSTDLQADHYEVTRPSPPRRYRPLWQPRGSPRILPRRNSGSAPPPARPPAMSRGCLSAVWNGPGHSSAERWACEAPILQSVMKTVNST